jgi:hypothetical protein
VNDEQAPDSTQDTVVGPLVFVSHDSRDAELAEAFCKLLSSVSAGMLKTFRSSDRKGSQGFEYGVEWYPELMRKLHAASDVVCLLTARSLGRPWILYEAGVAKGKIDAPVHGLALGVPLSSASTGPFAQFQNCDDEADSLTKLVVQLVRRLPSADPDLDMVAAQVATFRERVADILALQGESPEAIEPDPAVTSKLFEEIKVMFNDLPGRVEAAAEGGRDRGRPRIARDPRMIRELQMMSREHGDGAWLLVAFSYFRDELPWAYDLAFEVYRSARNGDFDSAKRSWEDLRRTLQEFSHGPGRKMIRRSEESMMMLDIAEEWTHMFRPEFMMFGDRSEGSEPVA